MHNGRMHRGAHLRAGLGTMLASTMVLQVLAACGMWVLLTGVPATCCPAHDDAAGASLSATCCIPTGSDASVPAAFASTMPAPQAVPSGWAVPPPASVWVGYLSTLPSATRGHTVARLSALLI